MFKVKLMCPKDFSFATELANTMDWNMAPEDFQFMSLLEPEGCFVLYDGLNQMGISTCISFGKVGWFGNLIVKEETRKKGAGSLLVRHAIDYLHGKGVETIGLYAYPNLVKFYGNLGFLYDGDFSVLHTAKLGAASAEALSSVGTKNILKIEKFDRGCFGGDRRKLLESIILQDGNLSYYISRGNKVVGYVAATVYETMAWVGPLMCQEGNGDVAVTLIKGILAKLAGLTVYVAQPKKKSALADMLSTAGFKEDFSVARMYLGPSAAKNCIYLAESLERG
jgi:GNAT superfamily N-acetyltransferase